MNLLHPTLIPLALALPGLPATASTNANGLFISHLENILGTSFDFKVVAPSYTVARQAETAALSEINRLSAILSSYQPDSEFNQWLATSIDGSAIFMTLISATGIILLLFLKKRRVAGLVLLVLGSLLVYVLYALS